MGEAAQSSGWGRVGGTPEAGPGASVGADALEAGLVQ